MSLFEDLIFVIGAGIAAAAVGAAAGYGIAWVVNKIIDKRELKKQLEAKRKGAFKALIMEKRNNAVDIGLFTKSQSNIEEKMTIKSDKGIGNDVYKGMVLECYG